MTTFTADAAQSTYTPREALDGVTTVVGSFQYAAVPSAGELVQMIKLPPNCYLVGLSIAGKSPGSAAGPVFKVGYTGQSGTASFFTAAASLSATQLMLAVTANMPAFLTVSDDTTVQYSVLTLKTATVGSATSTTLVQMIASYCRKGTGGA